ncbi:hypothetical protein B0H10DRAFT_2160400 [Mycena sp. CBHHK59/15]|nr:hypothetical protein B0H10DRAFT_2160400 [Mycena sp. CBHHK59/15]
MAGGPSARKPSRTDGQKIELILDTIQTENWTLSHFLYQLFRVKDSQGNEINRSSTHSQTVSIFLAGCSNETVADIIAEWMVHPDGRIPANSINSDLLYSTTVPYTRIRPVRAALTSFATQIVGKKVAVEAESAVKLNGGLHISIGKKHPETKLRREDFGEGTISRVQGVIEEKQPVTLYLFNCIAMRKARNLLPLMPGILYLGSSAPVELINYNCRIGTMPAPDTVRRALITLSEDEGRATQAHRGDLETAGFLFVNNTQNYARARDLRIGRESIMNIGIPHIDVEVFNLADKRALIALNRRKDITVDDLLGFVDQLDADATGALHFLEVLARCIPSLKPLCVEIGLRFSATATTMVPPGESIVHPLACSGKKETIPTELKDAMLDFLQQIGQTPEHYLKRKLSIGGDGLTYAMLLQLQNFLQYNNDAFKSFEIMEPQLQVWHTKWTDVIRVFQTHWGRTTGKQTNPASLGFSAAKIGRPAPSQMKKVEFYSRTQLMYLVLDAKILDLWQLVLKTNDIFQYFEGLVQTNKLPDVEILLPIARKLYRAYGMARGRDQAMHYTGTTNEWAQTVPTGSPWIAQEIETSSLEKKSKAKTTGKKPRKAKAKPAPKACAGDFVLAQEIDFIRDGLNSRKLATAVARGDISRMYECIKYMLFTFGSSTHTNYLNYLLETIMNLELESSPGLKVALLHGLVWNITGKPGNCEEGDFIVEFFNRLLEDVVEHKSAQFDDLFISQSRLADRVGMKKKAGKHSEPHTNPEMITLLKLYRDTELHSRRLGRQIDDRDTDNFARGVKKLRDGGLQTAIARLAANQQVLHSDEPRPTSAPEPAIIDENNTGSDSDEGSTSSDDSESSSDSEPEDMDGLAALSFYATRGSTRLVDGELVIDDRDMLVGLDDEEFQEEEEENSSDDYEESGSEQG